MLSDYDKADIMRSYRLAKNPTDQIYILADLYDVSTKTIRKIVGAAPRSERVQNKYTEEQRILFERDIRAGTDAKIASELYNINPNTARIWAYKILRGERIV